MNPIIIFYGSNIDPEDNVRKALDLIKKDHSFIKESEPIMTKALNRPNHADYLNGAWLVASSLVYDDFKTYLKEIEKKLGRTSQLDKFAPRTIDLDIIVFNGKIIHNDYHERDFVRKCVLEIVPDLK